MKEKISTTIEEPLLQFLDSLPGKTRSEKLERILLKFKQLDEELQLRKQLAAHVEDDDDQMEREVWERTVAEAMWTD